MSGGRQPKLTMRHARNEPPDAALNQWAGHDDRRRSCAHQRSRHRPATRWAGDTRRFPEARAVEVKHTNQPLLHVLDHGRREAEPAPICPAALSTPDRWPDSRLALACCRRPQRQISVTATPTSISRIVVSMLGGGVETHSDRSSLRRQRLVVPSERWLIGHQAEPAAGGSAVMRCR